MVESFKNELQSRGTPLDDTEFENIADIALNQIQGVAYKGRYFEEMVGYALNDLNAKVQHQVSGSVGNLNYHLDFLVEIDESRMVGIETVYSNQRYLNTNKLKRIRHYVETINKVDNFVGFILITNSEIRDTDMEILKKSSPPIDLIDKSVSPDMLLSRLSEYLNSVK